MLFLDEAARYLWAVDDSLVFSKKSLYIIYFPCFVHMYILQTSNSFFQTKSVPTHPPTLFLSMSSLYFGPVYIWNQMICYLYINMLPYYSTTVNTVCVKMSTWRPKDCWLPVKFTQNLYIAYTLPNVHIVTFQYLCVLCLFYHRLLYQSVDFSN